MGLRETKARRNRERIVKEGLRLFARDGYDATTMESIAEAAEVSPSTLYRTFASKELIGLAHVTTFIEQFAEILERSAADHPVEDALGIAILKMLEKNDSDETLLVREIIDKTPILRSRLWDYVVEQHQKLAKVVAKKTGACADDLHVLLTVQLVTVVYSIAADRWRETGGKAPSREPATELMKLLNQGAVFFPKPPKKLAKK